MYNTKLLDDEYIAYLHEVYIQAKPFSYVYIDDFLDPAFAKSLIQNFPTPVEMGVSYNGLNERKKEHSDFSKLHPEFSKLREMLCSSEFIRIVENITGLHDLLTINDRFGSGLHQGGRNSFLDIHIDYNLHPQRKKQRRINLILFLNAEWREDWGGQLEFWDSECKRCVSQILPAFNRCVLFVCNEISYHGYPTIQCPENISRQSFYLYFFTQPEKKVKFHDTVFAPTPNHSFLKKQVVVGKEFLKNTVKRVFYYAGLNKFLK